MFLSFIKKEFLHIFCEPRTMLITLGMPVLLLLGMIFPIENMPAILQWISNIIPARWFIAAVRKVMIEGLDAMYVVKELAILVGMAFFLIVVSVKKFKVRLA